MVGLVTQIVPHYRYPIYRELCHSEQFKFIIFSGTTMSGNVKLVDTSLADTKLEDGGLRWEIVKNIWLYKDRVLLQYGIIRKCLRADISAVIFIANPYYLSTWVCAAFLRLTKRKVYFWTHGVYKLDYGIKHFIRRAFFRLANGLFLYGDYAADILKKQGFASNKIHVIYNSLDYNNQKKLRENGLMTINEFRKSLFDSPELPQVLFIGRLTVQKRIHQLLEATLILRDAGFPINVLIVGQGEEENKLRAFVNKYELDRNVVFFGSSYNEETNMKLISSSNLCVSPGEVGLTAIHALTYGTPVITHSDFVNQMPEFESIEPGITGDFFEKDNVQDLCYKIKRWLTSNDSQEKTRLSCYRVIDEKFNPQYQHDKICSILHNDQIRDNQVKKLSKQSEKE